jgi:predicted cation transporter
MVFIGNIKLGIKSEPTNRTALWFYKNEIAVSTVHNCMLLVENLYLILQFIGESYTPFCTVYLAKNIWNFLYVVKLLSIR